MFLFRSTNDAREGFGVLGGSPKLDMFNVLDWIIGFPCHTHANESIFKRTKE
jgi:hypothetical protein